MIVIKLRRFQQNEMGYFTAIVGMQLNVKIFKETLSKRVKF